MSSSTTGPAPTIACSPTRRLFATIARTQPPGTARARLPRRSLSPVRDSRTRPCSSLDRRRNRRWGCKKFADVRPAVVGRVGHHREGAVRCVPGRQVVIGLTAQAVTSTERRSAPPFRSQLDSRTEYDKRLVADDRCIRAPVEFFDKAPLQSMLKRTVGLWRARTTEYKAGHDRFVTFDEMTFDPRSSIFYGR